jgi:hypothetical protein
MNVAQYADFEIAQSYAREVSTVFPLDAVHHV